MQEPQKQTITIRSDFFGNLAQSFFYYYSIIFKFFNLRSTKQFWGVVYDSVSKQPLDPVIVKLLYTDGREVETTVTDLAGRYGFLAKPGKFKIYVRKTNYTFPSKLVAGDSDGVYENLYHGEFFLLNDDSEVVAPNIPMDPEKADWNQQAKQVLMGTHPYFNIFLKRLIAVFFWFGLIFLLIFMWIDFNREPIWIYFTLAFYLLTVLPTIFLPEHRLWGRLVLKGFEIPPERFYLELTSQVFKGISFGKATVHDDARFLLRASKGQYLLTLSYFANNGDKVFLASTPIAIDRRGVFTSNLRVYKN